MEVLRESSLPTDPEVSKLNARKKVVAKAALGEYHDQWLLDHEELCFATFGTVQGGNQIDKLCFAHSLRCMPEHMGVAAVVKHAVPYTSDSRAEVLDMITLAQQEDPVYHRPNEAPQDGNCPVASCGKTFSR